MPAASGFLLTELIIAVCLGRAGALGACFSRKEPIDHIHPCSPVRPHVGVCDYVGATCDREYARSIYFMAISDVDSKACEEFAEAERKRVKGYPTHRR